MGGFEPVERVWKDRDHTEQATNRTRKTFQSRLLNGLAMTTTPIFVEFPFAGPGAFVPHRKNQSSPGRWGSDSGSSSDGWQPRTGDRTENRSRTPALTGRDRRGTIRVRLTPKWACGAAGSAPEWHSGGHRFDPGQVHHPSLTRANAKRELRLGKPGEGCRAVAAQRRRRTAR